MDDNDLQERDSLLIPNLLLINWIEGLRDPPLFVVFD